MDIIIVFRARSETMNFSMLLKSYKIAHQIVNTPRIINVSCGISIKTSSVFLEQIEGILARRKFNTYGGIYRIEQNNLNQKAIRIR